MSTQFPPRTFYQGHLGTCIMECNPAKEDLCIRSLMNDMVETICEKPNSIDGETPEKGMIHVSTFSVASKEPLETQEVQENMDSQKKNTDSRFDHVLNSSSQTSSAVDEDISGPTVDEFHRSRKDVLNDDYIPLSCPVSANKEELLSNSEKSFLRFLDDMQSLTTKEKTRAELKQLPIFQVDQRKLCQNTGTDNVPTKEQAQSSDMLTVYEIVSSQGSDSLDRFDAMKEDDMGLGGGETLDNNTEHPSSQMDSKLVDVSVGCHMSHDAYDSQPQLSPEGSQFPDVEQFVNRQLQSAYDATDLEAMDGSNVPTASPNCFSLTFIQNNGDKDSPLSQKQMDNQCEPNARSDSIELTKDTSLVEQHCVQQFSEHNEINESSSTDNATPKNTVSTLKPAPFSECEEPMDPIPKCDDTTGVSANSVQQVIESEHIHKEPYTAQGTEPHPEELHADLKTTVDVSFTGVVSGRDCGQLDFRMSEQQSLGQQSPVQVHPQHKSSSSSKDETVQTVDHQSGKDVIMTRSLQNVKTSINAFFVHESMQEGVKHNATELLREHANLHFDHSNDENTGSTMKQSDSVSDQTIQQITERAETVATPRSTSDEEDEETERSSCLPSAHAMALHQLVPDQEIESNPPAQNSLVQDTMPRTTADHVVPEELQLVLDQSVTFQENDVFSEADESLYRNEEGKLKEASRLPSPQFRWKYRPSCDVEDDLVPPAEDMDTVLGNIQPLMTDQCSRTLRVGLSRNQKVKRLHKKVH